MFKEKYIKLKRGVLIYKNQNFVGHFLGGIQNSKIL